LSSAVAAYRDVYPDRSFDFDTILDSSMTQGSPELIIQMLDKLVDNAVDFSSADDTITIGLLHKKAALLLSVTNPGTPLPQQMRSQLFDSMVSIRPGSDKHLGLGLYVAKLIAEGHGGRIDARNTDDGVAVVVTLSGETHGE
jgi:signal transduction histidine kinase